MQFNNFRSSTHPRCSRWSAMFSAVRSHVPRRAQANLVLVRRWLATETVVPPTAKNDSDTAKAQSVKEYEAFLELKAKEPPLRPQLNINARENHGLYHFFRKMPAKDGDSPVYETVEPVANSAHKKGA